MSRCNVCHHPIGDTGQMHGFCRTHAPCAWGSRYCSMDCNTCAVLWNSAADYRSPHVSVPAFDALAGWVEGFRRNSKGRNLEESIFLYEDEEDDFDFIHFMAQSSKIVLSWEDTVIETHHELSAAENSSVISDPDSPQLTSRSSSGRPPPVKVMRRL